MIRALVVMALGMFATWAMAHSWYPPECCFGGSRGDCAPIHPDRVTITSTGYLVDGIHHEEWHRVRNSPDTQYHGCFYRVQPMPSEDTVVRRMRCFFAPRPAS